MKRPLFWAILSYALGESACVTIGYDALRAGAVIVLLLFAFLFLLKSRDKLILAAICTLFFVLGFFYSELVSQKTKQITSAVSAEGTEAFIYGTVHEVKETEYGMTLTVRVKQSELARGTVITEHYRVIVSVDSKTAGVKPGCTLRARGLLKPFDGQRVPGGFDRRKYYLARGVLYELKKAEVELVRDTESGLLSAGYYGLVNALESIRSSLGSRLSAFAAPATAGILKGVLLGDRSDIPEDISMLYRSGGIAHILAISSLHITMMSGALAFILRLFLVPFAPAWILTLVITLMYALMTGFGFATRRAFIMLAISIAGKLLGRRYDLLTGLSLALFVMLIINPYSVYDSSLLMSAAAMFGVAMGRYMTNRLVRYVKAHKLPVKAGIRNKMLYMFVKTAVFSVGLNLILTPVIAYVYMEIPLYSIIVNLLVIPLMSVMVGAGFLALMVSFVSVAAAAVVAKPAGAILLWYDLCPGFFSKLPFARIIVGGVSVHELVVYYAAVLGVTAICSKKGLRLLSGLKPVKSTTKRLKVTAEGQDLKCAKAAAAFLSVMVVLCGGLILFIPRLSTSERIVVLDVGQGDGIFISTEDGINIMIDGGSSSQEGIGRYVIEPALKVFRVKKIDYWFVSHTDTDHVSGLLDILEESPGTGVEISTVVFASNVVKDEEYDRIVNDCKAGGINIISLDCFDYIATLDMRITCVHPDTDFGKNGSIEAELRSDKNEMSMALLYESRYSKALFTGDMGSAAVEHMLQISEEKGIDLKDLSLLKLPHHGSKNSLSPELYSIVRTGGSAVISCGRNNRYGHPNEEILEGLKEEGCRIYRTDLHGSVMITPGRNDKELKVTPFAGE